MVLAGCRLQVRCSAVATLETDGILFSLAGALGTGPSLLFGIWQRQLSRVLVRRSSGPIAFPGSGWREEVLLMRVWRGQVWTLG